MPRPSTIKDGGFGLDFKKNEVTKMAIEGWCGKPCGSCDSSCALDEEMLCSPDCENLNPDGIRNGAACNLCGCDAFKTNNGDEHYEL